jgi:hypothetical protein
VRVISYLAEDGSRLSGGVCSIIPLRLIVLNGHLP